MGTTIANPVIKLDFKGGNFFKGLLSTRNRFRSFFRDIGKSAKRGMKNSNSALIGGLSITKGVLIGFLSFATVSIFAKLFNVVKDVFTKIPKLIAKSGMEMESALVEVNKAVDLTAEQTETLRQELVNFARVTPTTTQQLLKIAAAGARMGVALDEDGNVAKDATKRLIDFAKSVAKADVAIEELSTDEIGRGVGKLLNLFGLTVKQTDNLTSTLNSAAQTSAAFANEILNATTRSAGVARQFKFTAAEAIAVSTTLIELGRTAEISGSSFERLLNIISKPESFEKFGKLLGITGDEFQKLIDKSPLDTIRAVFSELGKTRSVTEANKVLTDLFGTNVRLTGSVRGLAQGVKLLDKNLRIERRAFAQATSINKEFNLVIGTTASKLDTLKGSFIAAFQDLFVRLKPSIQAAIDGLFDITEAFTVLTENDTFVAFIKNLIEDFGNLTKSVGLFFVKLTSTFVKADKLVGGQGFFAILAEQVKEFTSSLTIEDFTFFAEAFNVLKSVLLGVVGAFEKIGEAVVKTKALFRRSSQFFAELFTLSKEGKEGIRRHNRAIDARIAREEKGRGEQAKKEKERTKKLFDSLKSLTSQEDKKLEVKKNQTEETKKQLSIAKEETAELQKQKNVAEDIIAARKRSEQDKRDLEERRKNRRENIRRPRVEESEAQRLIKELKTQETKKFENRSRIILDQKTREEFQKKQRERERDAIGAGGPGAGSFGGLQRGIEEGQTSGLGNVNKAKRADARLNPLTKSNQRTFEDIKKSVEETTENTNITTEEINEIAKALLNQKEASDRLKKAAQQARSAAGTRPRQARGQ